jgi:hypothetical protein
MAVSKTAKIMIASAAVICLVLLAGGLIVINFIFAFEKSLPYAAGLAAGCLVTSVKIIMLERAITISVDIGEKYKAGVVGSLLFLPRFLLTGALLAVAFIFPDILGRFGAVFGVLSMQFSAYAASMVLKRTQPDNFDNLNKLSDDGDDEEENDDDYDDDDDDQEEDTNI